MWVKKRETTEYWFEKFIELLCMQHRYIGCDIQKPFEHWWSSYRRQWSVWNTTEKVSFPSYSLLRFRVVCAALGISLCTYRTRIFPSLLSSIGKYYSIWCRYFSFSSLFTKWWPEAYATKVATNRSSECVHNIFILQTLGMLCMIKWSGDSLLAKIKGPVEWAWTAPINNCFYLHVCYHRFQYLRIRIRIKTDIRIFSFF